VQLHHNPFQNVLSKRKPTRTDYNRYRLRPNDHTGPRLPRSNQFIAQDCRVNTYRTTIYRQLSTCFFANFSSLLVQLNHLQKVLTLKSVKRRHDISNNVYFPLYFFPDFIHIFIIQYSSRLSSRAGPDLIEW
jgi:hypothetical protein